MKRRQMSELGTLLAAKLPLVVVQVKGYKAAYAGSIPRNLCTTREPTGADWMAGRVKEDGKVYQSMRFDTTEEAHTHARQLGYDPK
jgi:hypothetical protein